MVYRALITIIAALSLFFGWNFNNEKESLRAFEKNLREELGKSEPFPELKVLTQKGEDVNGAQIKVGFAGNIKDSVVLTIPIVLFNAGIGSSGSYSIKIYTNDPLFTYNRSTDEPEFTYEEYIDPEDNEIKDLPGHYSCNQVIYTLQNGKRPLSGKYPFMLKYFYGKGKVTNAAFTIIVP